MPDDISWDHGKNEEEESERVFEFLPGPAKYASSREVREEPACPRVKRTSKAKSPSYAREEIKHVRLSSDEVHSDLIHAIKQD